MVKSPHILLAGSNCRKVRSNLAHILDATALKQIDDEINRTTVSIFRFGEEHYTFALALAKPYWRQAISRCYYGAYNVVRSLRLYTDGHYSTESTDHKKIDDLPTDFPSRSTYAMQLPILRNDRNLCDYDHSGEETDLVISRVDALKLVKTFIDDARVYLSARGLPL